MDQIRPRQQTAWRIKCPDHGQIYLTKEEYGMGLANLSGGLIGLPWLCPICHKESRFDIEHYIKVLGAKKNEK